MQWNGAEHASSQRAIAGCTNFDRQRKTRLNHSHFKTAFKGSETIGTSVVIELSFDVRVSGRHREPPTTNSDGLFRANCFFARQRIFLDAPDDFAGEPDIQ